MNGSIFLKIKHQEIIFLFILNKIFITILIIIYRYKKYKIHYFNKKILPYFGINKITVNKIKLLKKLLINILKIYYQNRFNIKE